MSFPRCLPFFLALLQALAPPSAFAAAALLSECCQHKEFELATRLWDTLLALGMLKARPPAATVCAACAGPACGLLSRIV